MVPESHSLNPRNTLLQFFQLSAMPTVKRLKVKLSRARSANESIEAEHDRPNRIFSSVEMSRSKNSEDISLSGSFGCSPQSSLTSVSMNIFGEEKRTVVTTRLNRNVRNHSIHDKEVVVSGKRGLETRLYGRNLKKHKIDGQVMQQCRALLMKLMTHKSGWLFNQPVDPVKLEIPDYFDIISEPMDLGTIKSKLENKLYSGASEFAADVRLTFSNAMVYNPPDNKVHSMANKLNGIFELGWRSLEAKWNGEKYKVEHDPISIGRPKKAASVREHCPKTVASLSDIPPGFSMTYSQKLQLRKDLLEISKRKVPQHLLGCFRKLGLIGQKEEKIGMDFDAFDEETVWELQRIMRSYLDSRAGKSADTDSTCGRDSLQKDLHKGSYNSSKHTCGSLNAKLLVSPAACPSGSCGGMKCHCSRHNDFTQASSDVDSERSSSGDNSRACHGGMLNLDALTDGNPNKQISKLDPDSAGSLITADEEDIEPRSCPTTPAIFSASGGECESNMYDGQMSPSKALRAAMLRSRFVDTILKAQQKTLLSNGEKVDPVKMQQERERLERKQREEKARIEAQIKAAETALRIKEVAELKLQREREREAARIAIQKMKKTVEIDENVEIMKDLDILAGRFQSDYATYNESTTDGVGDAMGAFHGNLLERLGLFRKDDYLEEEDELGIANEDVEEGQIGS